MGEWWDGAKWETRELGLWSCNWGRFTSSTCPDHKQRGSVDVDAATCSVVVASSDCLKSGAPQVCSQQIQLTAVYVSTTFVFFYIVQTIC